MRRIHMLETSTYIDSLRRDTNIIAEILRRSPSSPVPSCPGWSVARLAAHLGAIYGSILRNAREGHGEDIVNELPDLQLPAEIEAWYAAGREADGMPAT